MKKPIGARPSEPEQLKALARRLNKPVSIAVSRLFSAAFGLVSSWLIVRFLGASGRGDLSAVLSASFILPVVLSLGMTNAVRIASGRGQAKDAINSARKFAALVTPFAIFLSLLLLYGPLGGLSSPEKTAACFSLMISPLTFLWLCDEATLSTNGRYLAVSVLGLVTPSIYLAAIGALALVDEITVPSLLIVNSMAVLTTLLASTWVCSIRPTRKTSSLPRFIGLGFNSWGAGVADVSSTKLDQVVLLPIIGSTALGLYSVASTIATIPLAVGYALNAKLFRRIAQSPNTLQRENAISSMRVGLFWGVVSGLAVATGAPMIPLIFGDEFKLAVIPCLIAAIGTFAAISAQVATSCLIALGRGSLATVSQVSGVATAILLLPLMAGNYQVIGAAAASSMGFLLTLGLSLRFLKFPLSRRVRLKTVSAEAWTIMFSSGGN